MSEIGQISLRYILMAGIVSVLDILFLALGWHSLLSFLKVKFSRLRSFALVWVGIFARATLWLRFFIGFGAQQWLGLKDIIIRGDKAQIRID